MKIKSLAAALAWLLVVSLCDSARAAETWEYARLTQVDAGPGVYWISGGKETAASTADVAAFEKFSTDIVGMPLPGMNKTQVDDRFGILLNGVGAKGWELVSVTFRSGVGTMYTFKRRLPE